MADTDFKDLPQGQGKAIRDKASNTEKKKWWIKMWNCFFGLYFFNKMSFCSVVRNETIISRICRIITQTKN